MATVITASIELTKIDKSKIFEKEGRKWLSLSISVNDETNYGNNVGISHNQSKEEREAKTPKTFIGNGKVVWTDGVVKLAEKEGQPPSIMDQVKDDLPF
jgi:beta-xylosidase